MKKILLIIATLATLTSCDTLQTYGNGIKTATIGGALAYSCSSLGVAFCLPVGVTYAYIDGKQDTRERLLNEREKEQADKERAIVRALGKAKAIKKGAKVNGCAWYAFWC